jgi:YegS/Rv2252/BmrU family lipid kinase
MNPTLLIINPRAGGGRLGRELDAMRADVEASIGAFDLSPTRGPGDAIRIAREACADGRRLVVAVGGDGTVHEVVSGLVEGTRAASIPIESAPTLGIVGAGTGGDFAKTLGLRHERAAYLDALHQGSERRVDVGRLEYVGFDGEPRSRFFVNILSMGVSGLVDRYVATATRVFGSNFAYYSSSLRGLFASRVGKLVCEVSDGNGTREARYETRILAICNGRYFGSGMEIAPMAKPDDGRFEVVTILATKRMRLIGAMNQLYTAGHMKRDDIVHFPCTTISVRLENEEVADRFLLDVDGEPLGRLPLRVELLPGAVKVRVPKPAPPA